MLVALRHLVLGVVACVLAYVYGNFTSIPELKIESIITNVSSIAAQIGFTLAGFVLATTAIFAAFSDKPLIKKMSDSGHTSVLLLRMLLAICYSFILSFIGMYFLFFPNSSFVSLLILVFAIVFCLSSMVDVLKKFWRILQYVDMDGSTGTEKNDEYENVDQAAKLI